MEIGLREWLILVGGVVIALILIDGLRRVSSKKNKLDLRPDPTLSEAISQAPETDGGDGIMGSPRVIKAAPSLGELAEQDNESRPLPSLAPEADEQIHPTPAPQAASPAPETTAKAAPAPTLPPNNAPKDVEPVEEVLIINVISRTPGGFPGTPLLENILASGLRFGDMQIFHRHEAMNGNGEVQFSMTNAIKPGYFEIEKFEKFSTPAVSFFMTLPGPRHPKQAFDLMVSAARKLAEGLNGELKDDQRSVMTAQTIEHYRQRIAEFERRRMTAAHTRR